MRGELLEFHKAFDDKDPSKRDGGYLQKSVSAANSTHRDILTMGGGVLQQEREKEKMHETLPPFGFLHPHIPDWLSYDQSSIGCHMINAIRSL